MLYLRAVLGNAEHYTISIFASKFAGHGISSIAFLCFQDMHNPDKLSWYKSSSTVVIKNVFLTMNKPSRTRQHYSLEKWYRWLIESPLSTIAKQYMMIALKLFNSFY